MKDPPARHLRVTIILKNDNRKFLIVPIQFILKLIRKIPEVTGQILKREK
jgi:hypothetical protein